MKKYLLGILIFVTVSAHAETVKCFRKIGKKSVKSLFFKRKSDGGMDCYNSKTLKHIHICASNINNEEVQIDIVDLLSNQSFSSIGNKDQAKISLSGPNGSLYLTCISKIKG